MSNKLSMRVIEDDFEDKYLLLRTKPGYEFVSVDGEKTDEACISLEKILDELGLSLEVEQ